MCPLQLLLLKRELPILPLLRSLSAISNERSHLALALALRWELAPRAVRRIGHKFFVTNSSVFYYFVMLPNVRMRMGSVQSHHIVLG